MNLFKRICALICAWVLVLGPSSQALAQSQRAFNLPQLGDPDAQDLSPIAERRLGEVTMREIRRDPAFLSDPELDDYLSGLTQRLVSTPSARRVAIEAFWVRDETLNAFAMPGGFVGVHSGLVLAAQSESELAAVMGHEIGHVMQRHLARMLAQEKQSTLLTLAGLLLAGLAARAGNIEGAVGLANLGSSIGLNKQLAFSRDAEREADRLGLEIVREAGFNPLALADFFQRLQQAGRVYDNNAPVYLRTHPLNTERIADVQLRLLNERYRQLSNSLEFDLVRARLRVEQSSSAESVRAAKLWFERALIDKRVESNIANFGIAHALFQQRDFAGAQRALLAAKIKHPYAERLESQLALATGDASRGLVVARQAHELWPSSRALIHQLAVAALAAKQISVATEFLTKHVQQAPGDRGLWKLMADAFELAGKRAASKHALSRVVALQQDWQAAVLLLQQAQEAKDADFVLASVIDTQMREAKEKLEQQRLEQKERK